MTAQDMHTLLAVLLAIACDRVLGWAWARRRRPVPTEVIEAALDLAELARAGEIDGEEARILLRKVFE